jgi:hypothetical protein
MVLTWVVAIVIIAFARYATRQIKAVPDGAQNFWNGWLKAFAISSRGSSAVRSPSKRIGSSRRSSSSSWRPIGLGSFRVWVRSAGALQMPRATLTTSASLCCAAPAPI